MSNKNNLKKTWSIIRSVINNCKPSKLNESFLYNNSVITDKNEVANKFNDYFVIIGKTWQHKSLNLVLHSRSICQKLIRNVFSLSPLMNERFETLS